ncbi:UNVERIFIED_CONTAM: Neuronal growth regulator 1 [Gekko kuhli]
MDMMLLVQGACCSNQWLAAVLLSLCCLLPSCLPAGQNVDFPGTAVENLVVRKGDTAVLSGLKRLAKKERVSFLFRRLPCMQCTKRVQRLAEDRRKRVSLGN